MHYRLADNYCSGYMATGYNSTSKEELAEDYKYLISSGS